MKKFLFPILLLFFSFTTKAQVTCNGTWGPLLVNQTFGQGNATDIWYGPLATYAPGATTSTTFVGTAGPGTGTLSDGQSGLAKSPNVAGQGTNWINTTDHTGDANGLMLLVNAPSTASTVFFEYQMDNLCSNTTLKLSIWVLNVNAPAVQTNLCGANYQFPNLTLRVLDPTTNAVLATSATGNVPIDQIWHQYQIVFNNGTNTSVKFQIVNNSVGSGCGNDLALDDITVQPCIPVSQLLPKIDTITCSNATIPFTANVIGSPYNPAEYQWQYSVDLGVTWINSGAASASPNYSFNSSLFTPGTYLVRYITGPAGATGNNNCIAISDTSTITIGQLQVTDQYEYICSHQTFQFGGQNLNIAGVYDDTLSSNVTGCDSIIRLHLTVVQSPKEIQLADSLIACQYDLVAFESNALPFNSNYTYQWTPSTNLNEDDAPNVYFSADQSRRYYLTVSNNEFNLSCGITDTLDVIVNPGDFLTLPFNDTSICPGDTVQLSSIGAMYYKWSPVNYLDNSDTSHPVVRAETSIRYQLIGTSDKGCTDTQFVNLTVHPSPVLEIPDVVNLYPGEQYYVQPNTNAVFFSWFPHSGINNPNISNPKLNPDVDTRYFVTATTDEGCSIRDSIDIRVQKSVVDMPNAFNPNNGNLYAVYRGIVKLNNYSIYNRWGQKVFETQNINEGWDGKFNGIPQPLGVYIYQIDGTTIEGYPFKKNGNVTLVR